MSGQADGMSGQAEEIDKVSGQAEEIDPPKRGRGRPIDPDKPDWRPTSLLLEDWHVEVLRRLCLIHDYKSVSECVRALITANKDVLRIRRWEFEQLERSRGHKNRESPTFGLWSTVEKKKRKNPDGWVDTDTKDS